LPPDTLAAVTVNISQPSSAYIGHRIKVDDGNLRYYVTPIGNSYIQIVLAVLLAVIPIITASLGVYIFKAAFYKVKFNSEGASVKKQGLLPFALSAPKQSVPTQAILPDQHKSLRDAVAGLFHDRKSRDTAALPPMSSSDSDPGDVLTRAAAADMGLAPRRTVLIATMEYNITDWNISIKLGGLGVMAGTRYLMHH